MVDPDLHVNGGEGGGGSPKNLFGLNLVSELRIIGGSPDPSPVSTTGQFVTPTLKFHSRECFKPQQKSY